ncbi:PLD nuclease N-terminal domain-containing protein [Alkalicoccus chagannorensis]|uniref:PLD nuclease N-terminal domain-containing protein n=1 Tax=Alkalicoccus chagannorensis TaxID=427072 RepID=UPI00040FA521|nr:PLD nuclease N-terminal domain-containing protein [Alkalicoccus chagannorensis]
MNTPEGMEQFPLEYAIPFVLVDFALTLAALISCVRQDMTKKQRVIWVLVIVFINFVGPIIYFIFGRNKASSTKQEPEN